MPPFFIRYNWIKALICFLLILSIDPLVYSRDGGVLFREEFNTLERWKPVYFQKVKKRTLYTIAKKDQITYLKGESRASASGIVLKHTFNVYEYPRVTWSWEAENIYKRGDASSKSGDDYPIRIYIMFKYDPERAGFFEKMKYRTAKLIYKDYPPHRSLNYIWANRKHKEKVITGTYTEKSKMIPLQMGAKNLGKWQIEDVNILEDYRMASGTDPPPVASIGIMNDSDNTGEQSVSYIDYIEISGLDPKDLSQNISSLTLNDPI